MVWNLTHEQDGPLPDFLQEPNLGCRHVDPELFFPVSDVMVGNRVELARKVCHACPHRQACLNWAMKTGERGIWGGTTLIERRRLAGLELPSLPLPKSRKLVDNRRTRMCDSCGLPVRLRRVSCHRKTCASNTGKR